MKEIPPLNPPLNQCWIFCKISEAATQSAAKYQTQVIIDAIAGSLSIQHQDLQKLLLNTTKIPQKISFRSQFCSGFILLCIDFLLHFQAIHSNLAWQGEVFTGNCDFWSCCEKCFYFDTMTSSHASDLTSGAFQDTT